MATYELTKAEKAAISSMRRLAKRWPPSLRVIIIDGDYLHIVKRGVPSSDIQESIRFETVPCSVLTDVHEDMGLGEDGP